MRPARRGLQRERAHISHSRGACAGWGARACDADDGGLLGGAHLQRGELVDEGGQRGGDVPLVGKRVFASRLCGVDALHAVLEELLRVAEPGATRAGAPSAHGVASATEPQRAARAGRPNSRQARHGALSARRAAARRARRADRGSRVRGRRGVGASGRRGGAGAARSAGLGATHRRVQLLRLLDALLAFLGRRCGSLGSLRAWRGRVSAGVAPRRRKRAPATAGWGLHCGRALRWRAFSAALAASAFSFSAPFRRRLYSLRGGGSRA